MPGRSRSATCAWPSKPSCAASGAGDGESQARPLPGRKIAIHSIEKSSGDEGEARPDERIQHAAGRGNQHDLPLRHAAEIIAVLAVAGKGESLLAVQVMLPGFQAAGRLLQVEIDPAHCVDHFAETAELDAGVILSADAKILIDRID